MELLWSKFEKFACFLSITTGIGVVALMGVYSYYAFSGYEFDNNTVGMAFLVLALLSVKTLVYRIVEVVKK